MLDEDEFYKRVCEYIENFGTGSIKRFMEMSDSYKNLLESMVAAEERYHEGLMGLSDDKKEVVNHYIKSCIDLQTEYSSLSYVSGLSDMLDILGQLGLIGCPFASKISPS